MNHIDINLLDVFLYPSVPKVLKDFPDAEVSVTMRADDLLKIYELAQEARNGKV